MAATLPNPGAARKRIRDYSAERQRRNELARERGFSSLDTQAKARRRGEYPTAREIRTSPAKRAEAETITAKRKRLGITASQMKEYDRLSARWSKSHGKQDGTHFRKNWSMERRLDFFDAFVRWWRIPHDERNFEPTYAYMNKYGGFTAKLDGNPYSGDSGMEDFPEPELSDVESDADY